MSPKKRRQKYSHKRIKITIEMKHKIIEKRERGVSVADLARTYTKQQSLGAIREMLKAWETVASYIEKHHPNTRKAVAMRTTNLFNNNAVLHFHQILKHQQKQMSLDSFLVKKN
ncbi:hypothetical protein B7P43_G00393 [Cryptotermes secundus]|uniref:Uncharacterized protein n=1 Tax=Cryptotermes secundus TaxID=105785 RepID=A0A2J7R8U8_9NEOP|nr:hypothetical protein B7P43_G00393 [Cryptotermes secundus]